MKDFERERLAVKAYCLSEVTGREWKRVMPKYGKKLKEWWIIPNIIWISLLLAGGFSISFNWYYPWLPIAGFLISALAARNLGSRYGNIDGFQIGYEWGKIDGVCRGLGIKETEQDKLLQSAHDLIIEIEVRIPLIPATDSEGRRPPIPEQGGRFLSERSDAGFS